MVPFGWRSSLSGRREFDGCEGSEGGALGVERNFRQPEIVRLYTVLSAEALNPDHPAHEYFRERLQQIRRLIAGSLALPPGAADDFAVDYLSFMDGLQLNWLRDPTIDFLGRWQVFADGLLARVEEG